MIPDAVEVAQVVLKVLSLDVERDPVSLRRLRCARGLDPELPMKSPTAGQAVLQ